MGNQELTVETAIRLEVGHIGPRCTDLLLLINKLVSFSVLHLFSRIRKKFGQEFGDFKTRKFLSTTQKQLKDIKQTC